MLTLAPRFPVSPDSSRSSTAHFEHSSLISVNNCSPGVFLATFQILGLKSLSHRFRIDKLTKEWFRIGIKRQLYWEFIWYLYWDKVTPKWIPFLVGLLQQSKDRFSEPLCSSLSGSFETTVWSTCANSRVSSLQKLISSAESFTTAWPDISYLAAKSLLCFLEDVCKQNCAVITFICLSRSWTVYIIFSCIWAWINTEINVSVQFV